MNCSSLPLLLTKKSASSVVTLQDRPGMASHGDPLATYPPFFIAVQLIHDSSSPFLSVMCKVFMHIKDRSCYEEKRSIFMHLMWKLRSKLLDKKLYD
jgi:hypothetical protein